MKDGEFTPLKKNLTKPHFNILKNAFQTERSEVCSAVLHLMHSSV
jgi:hypothetical protein